MKKSKMLVAASLCAASMMVLASCGSSASTDNSASGSSADTSAAATESGADGSSSDAAASKSTGSADFDSSSDISVISREDGSGTRGAFVELTGVQEEKDGEKVDMTTEDAQIANETAIVLTDVANDDYAIGYISLGSLDDTVKALNVDGAEPTADAIKSGDYTLARPFNIATMEGADNEVATDFINYIFSEDGQKIVEDNGYIAVDTKDYTSTQPSGKCVVGGSSSVSPLMEKLIEAYKDVNPNADIELQTTDSTTGMSSCADGTYDIGMASRELTDDEKAEGLTPQVIATDGIAVIVNKNNPLSNISKDQLKQIYTGDITTWDEVDQ